MAAALAGWCGETPPWAVLVPGTCGAARWRRARRRASAAGLTGDAVGFGVEDGRLVAWKPAFGGSLVAAITCTLRRCRWRRCVPGVLSLRAPRPAGARRAAVTPWRARPAGRVRVVDAGRDDEVEALLAARTVVAVGQGVAPDEYGGARPAAQGARRRAGRHRAR